MKHRKKKKKKKKVKLESFIPVLDQHRIVKEGYRSIFPRTLFLKLAVYICRNPLQFRSIPYSGIYKCCYSLLKKNHTHTHKILAYSDVSQTPL